MTKLYAACVITIDGGKSTHNAYSKQLFKTMSINTGSKQSLLLEQSDCHILAVDSTTCWCLEEILLVAKKHEEVLSVLKHLVLVNSYSISTERVVSTSLSEEHGLSLGSLPRYNYVTR